jgi:hypothetical protein
MSELSVAALWRPGPGMGNRGVSTAASLPSGWDPSNYGSVSSWFSTTTDDISVTSTAVDAWTDHSGNGVDLIGVATRKPIYDAASGREINGIKVVEFVPGDVAYSLGPHQIINASDGTVTYMAVCQIDDVSDSNNLISADNEDDTRGAILRLNHRPEGLFFRGGESTIIHSNGETLSDTALGVATMVLTATTVETWWNDTSGGSTSYTDTAAPTFTTPLALGGTADPTPTGNLDGLLAEVVSWDEPLSTGNRTAAQNELAEKWGITF